MTWRSDETDVDWYKFEHTSATALISDIRFGIE